MTKRVVLILFLITLLGAFLRFYQLSIYPHGLYIDEVSIGVNAYDILTKGKDEYGVSFPLWFKAFGEYKAPVYIYLTSLAMMVFGKTEFSVRFFSALSGTFMIPLVFFLGSLLQKKIKGASLFPLIAAGVFAVTPWSIHFSRGGFEANLALFFYLSGLISFFYSIEKRKQWFLYLSLIFFSLTPFTYASYRIIMPLTVLCLMVFSLRSKNMSRRVAIILSLGFIIFFVPIVLFSLTSEGSTRLAQTSAFSEYPEVTSIMQQLLVYPAVFIKNFLASFSPLFLFVHGDQNGRHQIPDWGVLLRWQIPFILIGILSLFKSKERKFKYAIFLSFLIIPLSSAITRPSPHTLRLLPLVIPFTLLTAWGITTSIRSRKKIGKIVSIVFLIVACFEFVLYFHTYRDIYPGTNGLDWGGEIKEVVQQTKELRKPNEDVFIDKNTYIHPIYFSFYAPEIPVKIVDEGWVKPIDDKNQNVLYIRPSYKEKDTSYIKKTIYLQNQNKDIYANIWEL